MDQFTHLVQKVSALFSVETNGNQAPYLKETLQSPTSSLQATCPSLLSSSDAVNQCPVSSPVETYQKFSAKLRQTPLLSPSKPHQPVPSPCEKNEIVAPSSEGMHEYNAPTQRGHIFTSPPEETCQIQEPCLENTSKRFVPPPEAVLPSLMSPTNLKKDLAPSSERTEDSSKLTSVNLPEIAPKKIHQSHLLCLAEPQNLKEGSIHSNLSTGDHHDMSRLSVTGHAKCISSLTSSQPARCEMQVPSSLPHSQSENQESPTPHQLKPESPAQCQSGATEFEFGPVTTRPCPAEQLKSPTHGAPALQSSYKLNLTSALPEQELTEDQQSPELASRSLHTHPAHSPPQQSLTQPGLSPSRFQPGSGKSRNYPDPETQLQSPCSPTSIMISQPKHSPNPCNPLEAGTSCIQSPTEGTQPRSDPSQNVCTQDPEAPHVYCSSTKKALRSCSAPCSPNLPLGKPRLHSVSQTTSPFQIQYNQTARHLMITIGQSIDSDGQTLKLQCSSANLSSTADPSTVPSVGSTYVHPCLPHVSARQTPESLDNSSTSLEHSSLTCSPFVQDTKVNQSPHRSLSPCPEAAKAAGDSPTQAEPVPANPAFCLKICESVLPTETAPTSQPAGSIPSSSSTQPDSPKCPPVRSRMELVQPAPTISILDEDIEVHPERQVPTETVTGLGLSLLQTDIILTDVHSSCSPHCTHTGPASSSVTPSLTSITSGGDSSPRTSCAGQASPVYVVQTQTPSLVSPPHSVNPGQDGNRPTTNTGKSTRLPQAVLSSASNSNIVLGVSLIVQKPYVPTKVLLNDSAVQRADSDVEMCPSQASSRPDNPSDSGFVPADPEDGSQSPDSPAESSQNLASPLYSDTAVHSFVITSDSSASPLGSAHSQVSPPLRVFTSVFQAPSSSVSNSGKSFVVGTIDSESHQPRPIPGPVQLKASVDTGAVSPLLPEPCPDLNVGPTNSVEPQFTHEPGNCVQPETCSDPDVDYAGSVSEEVSSSVDLVSPVPDILGKSEISLSPGPSDPIQPDSGSGQQIVMECISAEVNQRKTVEREEPSQAVKKNPEDDNKPAEMTEGGGDKKCQLRLVPVCLSLGVQLTEPSDSKVSTIPPAPCLSSPFSPPAGLPEFPLSSSPCRSSLPVCSFATPSKEDCPPEVQRGNVEEVGNESSQSHSLKNPVSTVTEPTKDLGQSHGETSEKQEMRTADRQLTVREKQEAEEEVVLMEKREINVEEETLVSPALDLDTSLDMEVMELMISTAPSCILQLSSSSSHPFSCRGNGRRLRPPPCSSRPSDDLSIRLRQSPFSTEASPETSPTRTPITPPPLTPPSPSSRDSPLSQVPPTTAFLISPKIGMGKPAISKRKFSPGRVRARQRSWWSSRRSLSPPSSSQDSMGEGDWNSPKPQLLDSPLWSIKVVSGGAGDYLQ
ncbi:hypothetical protein CHARACLAT_018249 [Characodon lateralis]|uniref:Uncharacterized protein n=1 Tax=Characodon lateralis TaxID=208331 RepID=A0ABU7F6I4_9TELE|nr:hypothetical protein [Characodon lateralis]